MSQIELLPGDLLDENGCLLQSGYSTQLIKRYNRKMIKTNAFRIKEWDYYLLYNQEVGIALTLADNGYMGMVSASFIDFKSKEEWTKSHIIPLTMGRIKMPECSYDGEACYKNRHVEIAFIHEVGARALKLNFKKFKNGKPFTVDLKLYDQPEDSIVIATPFDENDRAFYYNQKIVGLKVLGNATIDDIEYNFETESAMSGILDWGRGVWTYDNTWYWSSATGNVEGHTFGFNLGYGFGNTSSATENMLFYDGKAHKLEQVTFNIPQVDKKDDFMSEWLFTSSDQRFEAKFEPILDRAALTSLGILMSDQHQVFGYFSGFAVLDDGTRLNFDKFLGFAEKVRNKW